MAAFKLAIGLACEHLKGALQHLQHCGTHTTVTHWVFLGAVQNIQTLSA